MAIGIPRHCFRPRYVAATGMVSDEGMAQKTSGMKTHAIYIAVI
jgi:hypothetical protein